MAQIIAYSGSHGTGKTYDCNQRVNHLRKHTTLKIGLVTNIARNCPHPINKETTVAGQQWIFNEHLKKEDKLAGTHDVIIADRTFVDSIAYTKVAGFDDLVYEMIDEAARKISRYSIIYFKTIALNPFLKKDGVRSVDIDFQKEVEYALLGIYHQLGIIFDKNWVYQK